MNKQQVILHLSLIEGVSSSVIHKIIKNKSVHTAWADLYHFSISDFLHCGVKESIASILVAGLQDQRMLEKECASIERNNITYCTVLDSAYPDILKHIHVPPVVLYWQGAPLDSMRDNIAIVGSRKADAYGQQIIDHLVPQLVAHNITIVSGGALGLDAMAHRATIDVGGKTIVVLGSGLLNPAPRSNIKLFNEVIDSGGSIISCFPLYEDPFPHNFPIRNRIISGLSRGTIVVQAAEKSGARITAQYALEQGRDVFAIPGPINAPLSVGCHRLIQEGAKLVTHANDVLAECGITEPKQMTLMDVAKKPAQKKNRYKSGSLEDNIIQACMKSCSIDELAVQIKLNLSELQEVLFNLQLEGDIRQDFTGMWKSG